ncbi:laminin subunit beta-2 [Hippoglossus hippoglossus]|uniref:laminin subunit beta-2 n=2 Tax=Carangaria TaxID=1489904 RepID=UPI00148DBBC7|nr:laminin subunit beta-2 [Hippoglossus hippoglossus]XP_034447229.1 laminin subunit beta-2 [Hippoglossus hippoglossus]XP_034447230.1 laminin subunit beta-2 [Hippoglossus hippoglossus]XP_034447232.1 laminin subunit beta-2 [Hippoglossus hippoglossus]XP_034447233.1 laminin subunit beta-2 [Hippoglossus hippoglossus]XP_034447234.1 laminin subunit beta-2 [Hippoglossus hippoglossus]
MHPDILMPIMTVQLSLLMLALSVFGQDLPSGPHGCTDGSCYPATGNLLIGRAVNLTATSTCGLGGPEHYCIVSHLQESDKCFECSSQHRYDPYRHRNSHRIENVINLMDNIGSNTWWQSVNGQENVNIRLNLEAEFHFTHLIMKFKTFRPAAMIIERSADFGRTWRPYRYFASNCTRTFPGVSSNGLHHINDIICEERYSDIEPSTNGEVIYKVLDPAIHVRDPYSLDIQELLRITNLRINFTKLNTLGDDLLDRRFDVLQKYYYALYELVVRGSCFCYGHASECAPVPGVDARENGMIHGRCVCKHNSEGLNCERCKDFHHDLPWRPAEAENPHTCRECNCNGHSNQCHFDMAVYLATANYSGGVCDDCQHNTMGRNCEMCKPFYSQDQIRDIRDPRVCVACDCDPVGSLEGGVCDSHTDPDMGMISGQCRCKANVKGTRCDDCKEGYYGLSQNDPLGCQPCNCDPRGIIMMGAPCDQISGDCSCKRYVTGRYCNQCLPEYWGLSNDLAGCRPCDCDFGGAFNNRCMMENGQCDCRRHLIGRQCSEVQPGYFCAPLDYYKYEAEDATAHSPSDPALPGKVRPQAETDCVQHLSNQLRRHRRHRRITNSQQHRAALRRIRQLQQTPDVRTVHREHSPSHMVTWTGPGFARVKDGAGLVFTIDNIPYAMEYDIMIRYEPESTEDWEAVVSITSVLLPSSLRCGNLLPTEQLYTVTLPHRNRYIQMPRPFCFEPSNRYVVAIRFQRHGVSHRHLTAFILIDSLVLIPKYTELPGFQGNEPEAEQRREEMIRYMCLDSFMITPMPALAEMCSKLICSISSIIHDGALSCQCDPQGSLSGECDRVGGQCQCKPNVMGQHCDQCAPGTYGFGVNGCTACDCHSEGSLSHQCDPVTGQCQCRQGATGRMCSDCQPGQWGFPSCIPCQCNGHADLCDPSTGECRDCRDYTVGQLCERCVDGFFGNPVLGSGEHCRPCPCPGNPGSDHFNGHSCQADHSTNQIICNCKQGYTGSRCDQCAPGYYGNPDQPGGQCLPCECSGNIDTQDFESCDPRTGQCLKCLYNTDGPSCAHCQHGYYGNALTQDCRRCTCVTAGTIQSACSDGQCHCDRQTGACPCRENVAGNNCDQCAPNHWNYGQDRGCEPCHCDSQHALGAHCNMFTGQCHCRPGFGGKQCTECEQFHWGDPQVQCRECNCHPLGSEMAQCDRTTGVCECREGAAGKQCDECARGFTDAFPKCVRCHPCFQLWDDAVCQNKRDLDHIQYTVQKILESGVTPGVDDTRIKELEMKLKQVQDLISADDNDRIHQLIGQSIDDLRAEIALTDGRLMGVTRELNTTAAEEEALRRTLNDLERELRDINTTVAHKQRVIDDYLTSGFADQFEKIKKYYRQSFEAEQKCNASVYSPSGAVEQSKETRALTEGLLDASRDKFLRSLAAQNKSLNELQQKAHNLDEKVHLLSHKVCGGHSNDSVNGSCPDSQCGGAGCRDDQGNRVCGGNGCNGTVSASVAALNQAGLARNGLNAANEELQGVAKKLQDIAFLTQDVKNQAMNTLEKARKKKDQFENNNKKLKDFIKKIRDFLTEEGADPESIEKVALQVLAIKLPFNKTTLDNMVMKIKDGLSNLTNMEDIVNQTSQHISKAKELLEKAQQAKRRAEGVEDKVNSTKQALDVSEKAIEEARTTLEESNNNLNSTRQATAEVEERLDQLEDKQMDVMMRLNNLSMGVEALRNKTEQNRQMAKNAKALANNATDMASSLEQSFNHTEKRYRELRMKVDSLGAESGDLNSINQMAKDMKKEADDLLNKAKNGIKQLEKLEKKLKNNKQRMERQGLELDELKENATVVRDEIRDQVQKYSNCV